MGAIRGAGIVVGVAALVGIGVSAIEPHTARTEQERQHIVQQQNVDNGSDAVEQENERRREAGNAHGDAEVDRRNRPAEVRPKDDLPHVRIRFRP